MIETYAFWDLIVQEAYLPKVELLRMHRWERFNREDKQKKVWIFGFNEACKDLIEAFKSEWNIVGILDNSKGINGKEYKQIMISLPSDVVPQLDEDENVIILSLRLNADIVAKQLMDLGFANIYSLGVLISDMEPYYSFIRDIDVILSEPLEDYVMMESTNDFDGNTGALYEYLRRVGSDYKFVWVVKNNVTSRMLLNKDDIAICLGSIESLKTMARYRAKSKWQIWECDPIKKVRVDQINVFLQHYGMGYKQVSHLYNSPSYVDYALTTNSFVHEMEKHAITYAETTKFIYGELPRNDVLSNNCWDELKKVTTEKYEKVVMWAPTLRESAYYHRVDSDITYPYGISLIYRSEDMEELNECLKDLNILLIIKIHPRQKVNFEENECSNIRYLDRKTVKKLHAYKLLTQIDALITDYSSIVFDYMLLDRPCAWVLEDREHYKIDYLMDNPEEYMPGDKIYKMDDLHNFLKNVSEGRDMYREERRKICARCNPPAAGKGCERIAEVLGL